MRKRDASALSSHGLCSGDPQRKRWVEGGQNLSEANDEGQAPKGMLQIANLRTIWTMVNNYLDHGKAQVRNFELTEGHRRGIPSESTPSLDQQARAMVKANSIISKWSLLVEDTFKLEGIDWLVIEEGRVWVYVVVTIMNGNNGESKARSIDRCQLSGHQHYRKWGRKRDDNKLRWSKTVLMFNLLNRSSECTTNRCEDATKFQISNIKFDWW